MQERKHADITHKPNTLAPSISRCARRAQEKRAAVLGSGRRTGSDLQGAYGEVRRARTFPQPCTPCCACVHIISNSLLSVKLFHRYNKFFHRFSTFYPQLNIRKRVETPNGGWHPEVISQIIGAARRLGVGTQHEKYHHTCYRNVEPQGQGVPCNFAMRCKLSPHRIIQCAENQGQNDD